MCRIVISVLRSRPLLFIGTVFCASMLLTACGEIYDLNGHDWEPDVPASDSVFNREVQVIHLGDNMPRGHAPLDNQDPIFFSLEKFSSIATAYRSSNRWDITFSGTARSEIGGNSGRKPGFGHGAAGIGALAVVEAFYDDITEVPEEHLFVEPGFAGLDDQGEFGAPYGHAVYTFFGNFIRESLGLGMPDDSYWHMVYPLNKQLLEAFPNATRLASDRPLRPRTIVVKTASGNYAKIEVQSFYKDVTDPARMIRTREHPVGYITFRYMVIKAEDRRFGFVARKKKLIVNMTTGRTNVESNL